MSVLSSDLLFREAAWRTHHRNMCRASAQSRDLKAFCDALHPTLQPLRCYPQLLANIIAAENMSNLADSNIMRSFYDGNGDHSKSACCNRSAPLAFRNLDMNLLSELVSAAAGSTSTLPIHTIEQLLQLIAANAMTLRPTSQFPDYIRNMKRHLTKSEYDVAVQELFSMMPKGMSSFVDQFEVCSFFMSRNRQAPGGQPF